MRSVDRRLVVGDGGDQPVRLVHQRALGGEAHPAVRRLDDLAHLHDVGGQLERVLDAVAPRVGSICVEASRLVSRLVSRFHVEAC